MNYNSIALEIENLLINNYDCTDNDILIIVDEIRINVMRDFKDE